MLTLVMVVFTTNILSNKLPLDARLFAIALTAGIAPALLPAISSMEAARDAGALANLVMGAVPKHLPEVSSTPLNLIM